MANFMANVAKTVLVNGVEKQVQTVYCPTTKVAVPIWLESGQIITPYFTGEICSQNWSNEKKGTSGVQTFCFFGESITASQYNDLQDKASAKNDARETAKEAMEMLKLQIQLAQLQNGAVVASTVLNNQPLTVGV